MKFGIVGALLITTTVSAQPPAPPVVQLTLADAVARTIEHNPDLAIVRLDTEVEAARVGEAKGAYAPVFSTALGRSRNTTPPISPASRAGAATSMPSCWVTNRARA